MADIQSNALKTAFFATSSTTYTLPEAADFVNTVLALPGGATAFTVDSYSVTPNVAPTSNTVEFNGTPGAPGATLTFETAPAAGSLIIATYLPAGTL